MVRSVSCIIYEQITNKGGGLTYWILPFRKQSERHKWGRGSRHGPGLILNLFDYNDLHFLYDGPHKVLRLRLLSS